MKYVYVLKSDIDGNLYIGKTHDVTLRLESHNKGEVNSTSTRRPFKLATYVAVEDDKRADELEKYFKSGSGKAFLRKHLL